MKDKITEPGWWNGQPATISGCLVKIQASPDKPLWWNNAFIGQTRQAIEITQGDITFHIDNECGDGFHKATKGMGCPPYGHRSLDAYEVIEYIEPKYWYRIFDNVKIAGEEFIIKEFQEKADPLAFAKLQSLEEEMKKFTSMSPGEQARHINNNMMVKASSPSRQFHHKGKKDGKGKR